jgi:indole-3-acetate monooxygenase
VIIEVTTTIERPAEEVFSFLVDCRNDPTWRGNIKEAQLVRGKPGNAGSAYKLVAQMMGQLIDMEAKVVTARPAELFEIAVASPQGEMVTTTRMSSPSPTSTEITMATDLTPLGPMASMAAGIIKAETTKDLTKLSEVLSGAAATVTAGVHGISAPAQPQVTTAATPSNGQAASNGQTGSNGHTTAHGVVMSTSTGAELRAADPAAARGRPTYALRPTDHGTRRTASEQSLFDIARSLEPAIRAHEEQMEVERRIPQALTDELYRAGVFNTFTPKELGGLQVDPVEWLEMVEELSRISGAVGWSAMVNGGAVMVPRERYADLTKNGTIPWITAGNAGRMAGKAKRVEGGYLVSGRWPFTSGATQANFVGGVAVLYDDDDQVVIHPGDGMPWSVYGLFPVEDVTLIDTWDGLGVRGSGSGDFEVHDAFVPAYVADRSMKDLEFNEMLFRENMFILAAHSAHAVGLAQAALDEYIVLCNAKKADGSRRQAEMGRHQMHRINVAKADALIRSSRLFGHDAVQRVWDEIHELDSGVASLEARAVMFESFTFVVQQCREAVDLIFRSAGVGGVFRGTRLERIFRDMMTVAQHIVVVEERLEEIGQYWISRASDRPAIPLLLSFTVRTPKPELQPV